MRLDRRTAATCLVLAGSLVLPAAHAQERAESLFDRDRNESVTEREHPEYAPIRFRRGAFVFTPAFDFGGGRAFNVLATDDGDETDVFLVIEPRLNVETTWSRHKLEADASVTRRQFFEFSDESVWNWTLDLGGRFDIQRDTFIEAGIGAAALTEDRLAAGAASRTVEPIAFDRFNAFLGGRKPFSRILLQGEVGLSEVDYDDTLLLAGGVSDQDFRDHVRRDAMVRADYAISPDTAVFGRLRVNERDYDLSPPAVSVLRDSSGYTVDAGADLDLGGIARGVVGVGYTEQDYDAASLPTIDGISVDGLVEWFPTQLTTVTFDASRDVGEAPFAGSGGFLQSEVGAGVDHELRRNVILSSSVRFREDDYVDIDRIDERVTFEAGVTYLMNRWIGVRVNWTYIDQTRGGAGLDQDFTYNAIGVSVVRP